MGIINIRPVESGQSKSVIGIAGISGSGKTYTALLIARGMVNKASEIGFLDTENKRGSLYADILDDKFLIGDLNPPFTPERYALAIKEFQLSGVKVLVIDSTTHEWEGEGGCDDIANAPKADGSTRKVANWIGAKREHKQFMNVLLQSNMDIICCIRAREKTDFKNPNQPVSLGIQPICEKNFMFEMTASILMENEGKTQKFLKVPSFLKEAFGDGNGYLGLETGKKIRSWLDKGAKDSPEIELIKSNALLACDQGLAAVTTLWETLSKTEKIKLKNHFSMCVESAKAYDKLKEDNDDDLSPEDKLKLIKELIDKNSDVLSLEEMDFYNRIVDSKDSKNYDRVIYQLKKLKNE